MEAERTRQGARDRGTRVLHGDQGGRCKEISAGEKATQELGSSDPEPRGEYNASVLVDRNLEAGRAEKVAIFYGDEEVTYGELARRINRFGHALRESWVETGRTGFS